MRRLRAGHVFDNRARLSIYQIEGVRGVPAVDKFELVFLTAKGVRRSIAMRPDELVILIELGARALYRAVNGYRVERIYGRRDQRQTHDRVLQSVPGKRRARGRRGAGSS